MSIYMMCFAIIMSGYIWLMLGTSGLCFNVFGYIVILPVLFFKYTKKRVLTAFLLLQKVCKNSVFLTARHIIYFSAIYYCRIVSIQKKSILLIPSVFSKSVS